MTSFTPVASLAGGILIGLSAVLLLAAQGRIAGISGIAARLLPFGDRTDRGGAAAFVLGLVAAPLVVFAFTGTPVVQMVSDNLWLMAGAGLLVGFGSVWGSGCTSGHGVCGLARLSPRSLVATLVFMGVAGLTVSVVRHGLGG